MEGRRISRRSRKYNPLFILFLCMAAAVAVLLITSIALGAKLGKANKTLKTAEDKIAELEQTVADLEDDLAAAQKGAPVVGPSGGGSASGEPGKSDSSSSWLDLTGHTEVKVTPQTLQDGYVTHYTTAAVNLRGGPATSYDRIMTVDYGTKVEVAAQEGGWSFAKVGNRFGWISSDYLSTTQPTPQPTRQSAAQPAAQSARTTRAEATSGNLKRA